MRGVRVWIVTVSRYESVGDAGCGVWGCRGVSVGVRGV